MPKAKKTDKEEADEKAAEEAKSTKKTTEKTDIADNKDNKPSAEEKKAKLAKLLEKAKKLEGTVEELKDVNLKSKIKPQKDDAQEEKKNTLVPMEDYLKSSIHLGTRVITPDMRKYVYRRRADGLAVFNTALLDDKIKEGAEFLAKYAPK